MDKIYEREPDYNYKRIPNEVKNLVRECLQHEPSKRKSVEEILSSEFLINK